MRQFISFSDVVKFIDFMANKASSHFSQKDLAIRWYRVESRNITNKVV